MRRKVFVSFRFADGKDYKEEIIKNLESRDLIVDKSEDVDRSHMSEEQIKEFLFKKLRDSSITIVILTPKAINYEKDYLGNYDDWLYDELRYSLYDREDNRINGVIALYTEDAEGLIITKNLHKCNICNEESNVNSVGDFDNLVRRNMMNVLNKYKKNKCDGIYNSDYDSYISLIKYSDFMNNPKKYIEIASEKRENRDKYEIKVYMK